MSEWARRTQESRSLSVSICYCVFLSQKKILYCLLKLSLYVSSDSQLDDTWNHQADLSFQTLAHTRIHSNAHLHTSSVVLFLQHTVHLSAISSLSLFAISNTFYADDIMVLVAPSHALNAIYTTFLLSSGPKLSIHLPRHLASKRSRFFFYVKSICTWNLSYVLSSHVVQWWGLYNSLIIPDWSNWYTSCFWRFLKRNKCSKSSGITF